MNYKFLTFFALLSLILTIPGLSPGYALSNLTEVEDVRIQPRGGFRLELGATYEEERELIDDREYNNVRFAPLRLRYGLRDDFEIALGSGYSLNREVEESGLAEEGFEAVEISGKYRWGPNFSISGGYRHGGSNDVYPHGNDNRMVWMNAPFKTPAGPGAIHYEVGYTFADGRTGDDERLRDHWNWGIGYYFVVSPQLALRSEIVARERLLKGGSNHRDVVVGFDWRPTRYSTYRTQLQFGVDDGSPDYGVGIKFSYDFGDQGPEPEPIRDAFRQTPIFGRAAPEPEEHLVVPPAGDEPGVVPPGPLDEAAVREVFAIVDEGLRAFEEEDFQTAAEHFEEAREKDPDNPDVLINLATVYYFLEDYERAAENYQRAVDIEPEEITAMIGLAASKYMLGDQEAALELVEEVLERAPGNEQAEQWLEELQDE